MPTLVYVNSPSVKVDQGTIDRIFREAEHQTDYVIGLYRHAYGDKVWDDEVKELTGYPACSKATGEYIMGKAIDYDKEHHPDVMAGGLWMNMGWKIDAAVADWKVKLCDYYME